MRLIEDREDADIEIQIFGFDNDGPVPQWYDENIGRLVIDNTDCVFLIAIFSCF